MTDTSLQLDSKENLNILCSTSTYYYLLLAKRLLVFYGLDFFCQCPISSNLGRPMALKEQEDVLLVYEQKHKVHHLHPLATLWLQLLTSFCKSVY